LLGNKGSVVVIVNASYVCLHAFSLRQESPDLDPGSNRYSSGLIFR
jgi:hypothetical protein